MNTKIFLSIAIILLCFSCKSKTKQEVGNNSEQKTDMPVGFSVLRIPEDETPQEEVTSQEDETSQEDLVYFEIPQDSFFQDVFANFYKYEDENRLYEVLVHINSYLMESDSDTLFIFNFEKGTVRGVHGRIDGGYYINYIKGFPTERTISGDFNGDGKIDSLMLEDEGYLEKLGEAINLLDSLGVPEEDPRYKELYEKRHIFLELSTSGGEFEFVFSDKTIPGLKVISNFDYTIKNEGDLDGDGSDEIGFLYGWGSSNCRSYRVYTLKNNKWYELIDDMASSYNTRAMGIVPIEKDPEQEGVILIRSANLQSCSWSTFVIEKSIKAKDFKKRLKIKTGGE